MVEWHYVHDSLRVSLVSRFPYWNPKNIFVCKVSRFASYDRRDETVDRACNYTKDRGLHEIFMRWILNKFDGYLMGI